MSSRATAIDVALLLPASVDAAARACNARLSGALRFDGTHLPHLTILQQFVTTAAFAEVEQAIGSIADGLRPLRITVPALVKEPFQETAVWYWQIEPSSALTALHGAVSTKLAGLSCDGAVNSFYTDDGETVQDSTVEYVRKFRATSAGPNFQPHITLGLGDGPPAQESFAFDANHVAVCHLGNFNTCRQVLYERHV